MSNPSARRTRGTARRSRRSQRQKTARIGSNSGSARGGRAQALRVTTDFCGAASDVRAGPRGFRRRPGRDALAPSSHRRRAGRRRCVREHDRQAKHGGAVGVRYTPGADAISPVARGRRDRARAGRCRVRPRLRPARDHPLPRHDRGGDRATTRLATRDANSRVTFTFRQLDGAEHARQVFSPLLVRFDRIDESVMPLANQEALRDVLAWYKAEDPVWFGWSISERQGRASCSREANVPFSSASRSRSPTIREQHGVEDTSA